MTGTTRFVRPSAHARAVTAEPRLQAVEAMVDALCELVRPADTMCSGCVWDTIVKPLATPLVGWGRGYEPKQARDPRRADEPRFRILTVSEIRAESKDRPAPISETEAWMRTTEAWDAVTGPWLARLEAADPANGHGICRHRRNR